METAEMISTVRGFRMKDLYGYVAA